VLLQALRPRSERRHYRLQRLRTPAELRRLLGVHPGSPTPDMSDLPMGLLLELLFYATPRGTYFDAFPIHIVSTNSLEALSTLSGVEATSERFRPNLVVRCAGGPGYPEVDWRQHRLRVGEAELAIVASTFRCGMPSHAQAGLAKAPAIVRTVYQKLDTKFGVYARVVRPGRVALGDRVLLIRTPKSALQQQVHRMVHALKWLVLRQYLRL
jgi:hypothetical protein